MSPLRLCSSRQLINVLKRNGFVRSPYKKGSHQAYQRKLPDGRFDVAVIVEGKTELPRGTIRAVLKQAKKSVDEYLKLLK